MPKTTHHVKRSVNSILNEHTNSSDVQLVYHDISPAGPDNMVNDLKRIYDTNRQNSILIDITVSIAYLLYPNDFLLFIDH